MQPVLFEWPWGGTANGYGTMVLVAMLATMPGVAWDARNRGIAGGRLTSFVVDFYLVMLVGAVVGGRVLHVLTEPAAYLRQPALVFAGGSTGFVFFGSLGGAVAGLWWLARKYETTFGRACDVMATWAPLGHAFGRLGCYLAGCCWGAPFDGPWAVQFPAQSVVYADPNIPHAGDLTVGLHPSQLYEATGLLLVFALLVSFRLRRGSERPWIQVSRYAVGYGVLRFVTELTRGDAMRGFAFELRFEGLAHATGLPPDHVFGLSTSQLIAVVLIGLGVRALRHARDTS